MNNREKQIIEGLFNTENEAIRSKSILYIFHGKYEIDKDGKRILRKTPYAKAIENAVRKLFSGNLFFNRFEEVYYTFEAEFLSYLTKISHEKLYEIEQLDSWLFKAACNFASNKYYRKKVCEALCVDEGQSYDTISLDDEDHGIESKASIQTENTSKSNSEGFHNKIPESDNEDESEWAEIQINTYIDKIPHEYYRTVIRALVIEGMSREEFALEVNKKVSAVNNDVSRAMNALIQVALPDIRWRKKQLYVTYRDEFINDKYKDLLEQFYMGSKSYEELGDLYGLKETEVKSILIKSIDILKNKAINNPKEYSKDELDEDYYG